VTDAPPAFEEMVAEGAGVPVEGCPLPALPHRGAQAGLKRRRLDPDATSGRTVVGVDDEEYTVGAVAKLAGVSVRLLHHYDRIGLLEPSGRSAAGYRIYSLADLKRLQQVLFYRELGFTLEDIARILAASTSAGGSTTARMTCTAAWPSCTWQTSASARTTTTWRPASPGMCTMPCWPMRAGPRARAVTP
jgi:DNA-binding transcriptional MerR regulator